VLSPYIPSYEELFQSFIDRKILSPIARKQTQNTSIPWEDAAQVAYEKLWQATQQGGFRTGSIEEYCRWAARVACFAIIDYVRRENRWQCSSLDQPIPGTDIPLLNTLVDEFDALDAIAQADLLLEVVAIITELDRRYPQHRYLPIWQGFVQGKKQTQIANKLKVDPSEISKRWKIIRQHVAKTYATETYPDDSEQWRIYKNNRQRSGEQW
jgi:RNA polymerase sigma factor (sigma-70 family)